MSISVSNNANLYTQCLQSSQMSNIFKQCKQGFDSLGGALNPKILPEHGAEDVC